MRTIMWFCLLGLALSVSGIDIDPSIQVDEKGNFKTGFSAASTTNEASTDKDSSFAMSHGYGITKDVTKTGGGDPSLSTGANSFDLNIAYEESIPEIPPVPDRKTLLGGDMADLRRPAGVNPYASQTKSG